MGNIVREIDYVEMAKSCDGDAREKFKGPAYSRIELSEQARKLIRAQGRKIMGKGVDAGGQVNPD